MSYRYLINPLQGTKIVIEGMKQKSGKTLLGVTMILAYARRHPKVIIYGNIDVKHSNYIMKKEITQKDFEKNKQYILFIDELDLDYPWQDAHRNEGVWAFWGRGSSHNKCAVVCTIQNEYSQMRNILRRTLHILVHRTIGDPPFKVICDVIYSEYGFVGGFIQNIEIALDNYDPFSTKFQKINFNSWKAARIKENEEKNKTPRLHAAQRKAVAKLLHLLIEKYGNITEVSRKTRVSTGFIYDILGDSP